MNAQTPPTWTADLNHAASDLCTQHRNRDIASRAREIFNGARVHRQLTPLNVEFVNTMRSRFEYRDNAQLERAFDEAWSAACKAAPAPAPRWYVATYGNSGLQVEFFSDPLAYGRACQEAKRQWEAGGWGIDSYVNGDIA